MSIKVNLYFYSKGEATMTGNAGKWPYCMNGYAPFYGRRMLGRAAPRRCTLGLPRDKGSRELHRTETENSGMYYVW